jgi:hypothetical protein
MPRFVACLCVVILLAACESQHATVVSTDAPQLTDEQTQQMIPGSVQVCAYEESKKKNKRTQL